MLNFVQMTEAEDFVLFISHTSPVPRLVSSFTAQFTVPLSKYAAVRLCNVRTDSFGKTIPSVLIHAAIQLG